MSATDSDSASGPGAPSPAATTIPSAIVSTRSVPAATGSGGCVLRDFVRRAERLYPTQTAVVCDDHYLTYREFALRARKVAGALRGLGVGKGERVAVLMLNCHRYLELYAGCFELGAIIVPLNTRLAVPELVYALNDVGAVALVVDETLRPLAEAARPALTSVREYVYSGHAGSGAGALPAGMRAYEVLVTAAEQLRDPPPINEADIAAFVYTSGPAGNAKGVMLSNRNIAANALHVAGVFSPSRDDRVLHSVPMFHLAGGPTGWLYILYGGTQVVEHVFTPGGALALVERERITRVTWVPTMLTMLLAHSSIATTNLSSLKTIGYGASPIAPDHLKRAMEIFECEFIQAYGMTEASPVLTLLLPEDHQPHGDARSEHRLLSCGREVPGVSVRVVDPLGREVQPGEVGEITAHGDNIMLGYWHKPEETAAVLRDGCYYTGDLGTMDEDGYLYIVDRKKDMIVTGGENVYSTEVEVALSRHQSVLESAVIPVPDEQWGEVVKAIVALRPGTAATADDLIGHCRRLIAGYKCPRSVDFVPALPKSGTGTILKHELREAYWQGKARRVN